MHNVSTPISTGRFSLWGMGEQDGALHRGESRESESNHEHDAKRQGEVRGEAEGQHHRQEQGGAGGVDSGEERGAYHDGNQ